MATIPLKGVALKIKSELDETRILLIYASKSFALLAKTVRVSIRLEVVDAFKFWTTSYFKNVLVAIME
jgi:hypothetical protein